jgi:hypothetical protein
MIGANINEKRLPLSQVGKKHFFSIQSVQTIFTKFYRIKQTSFFPLLGLLLGWTKGPKIPGEKSGESNKS